jgi:hypothetical protein
MQSAGIVGMYGSDAVDSKWCINLAFGCLLSVPVCVARDKGSGPRQYWSNVSM